MEQTGVTEAEQGPVQIQTALPAVVRGIDNSAKRPQVAPVRGKVLRCAFDFKLTCVTVCIQS
jgi:hypothetical protein